MTQPNKSSQFSVCVFCGAREGVDPAYMQAGVETGKMLTENGWRLVYGAGDVGIMGAVARSCQEAGGETFGVIPVHLLDMEVGKRDLSTFVVTENMHERKKVMFMNADAIVVLPGGAGSLDEFFEVLTWKQIGLHDKPIYLVNTNGYWDKLNELIVHVVDNGFAGQETLDGYNSVADVDGLTAALRSFASSRQS